MAKSTCPEIAREYFRERGVAWDAPVVIVMYFRDGHGWRHYPYRKRVSINELRKLRKQGVTHVALQCFSHTADFGVKELLSSAKRREVK
jgi:hypothetical protein